MTRIFLSVAATLWCGFFAWVLLRSSEYAVTPYLTLGGLVVLFVGWLMMIQIARDC